jgi:hypothetical protein
MAPSVQFARLRKAASREHQWSKARAQNVSMRERDVQTASIASPVTARPPSLAAPNAALVTPSTNRWIGMFRTSAAARSANGNRLQSHRPPRSLFRCPRARPCNRQAPSSALTHGLHNCGAIRAMAEPVQHSTRRRIIVRRPLPKVRSRRQLRQKTHSRGRFRAEMHRKLAAAWEPIHALPLGSPDNC